MGAACFPALPAPHPTDDGRPIVKDRPRRPKSGPAAPVKSFAPAKANPQKTSAAKTPVQKPGASREQRPAPETPARPLMRR